MKAPSTVQLISQDQIDSLKQLAIQSARKRVNRNFHPSLEDNPHRFLNVMAKGSYVAPHRHHSTPKPETFLVLEGSVAVLLFNDAGAVTEVFRMGEGTEPRIWGIDLAPGIWHTLVVLSETATLFEVKPGPYVPASDKDFAPWAPREGEAGVEAYLDGLLGRAQQS